MKQQLLEKWKLEEKCFEDAVMKDLKGKEFKWPRNKPTEQIVFEQNFLDKVLDPDPVIITQGGQRKAYNQ